MPKVLYKLTAVWVFMAHVYTPIVLLIHHMFASGWIWLYHKDRLWCMLVNHLVYCFHSIPISVNIIWATGGMANKSRVSCQKGPICHAYVWRIGPFWQDTIDKHDRQKDKDRVPLEINILVVKHSPDKWRYVSQVSLPWIPCLRYTYFWFIFPAATVIT